MKTVVAKSRHWNSIAGKHFGIKSLHVPADLVAVGLWSVTGLIMAVLIATSDAGADLAGILLMAE